MKAWNVTYIYEVYGTVVFAETAGQAKAIARRTNALEDADYIGLRVRRMPKLDGLADEPGECDWDDAKIIIALVREYGWGCTEPDAAKCKNCPAVEWCDWRAEKGGGRE